MRLPTKMTKEELLRLFSEDSECSCEGGREIKAEILHRMEAGEELARVRQERDEARNLLGEAARAVGEVAGPVHERIRVFRQIYSNDIAHFREKADLLDKQCDISRDAIIDLRHKLESAEAEARRLREALPAAEELGQRMYKHHQTTWNAARNPQSVLTPCLESWEQTNQHNHEYWIRMARHALAALPPTPEAGKDKP